MFFFNLATRGEEAALCYLFLTYAIPAFSVSRVKLKVEFTYQVMNFSVD